MFQLIWQYTSKGIRALEVVAIVAALWVSTIAITGQEADSHNRAWQRIAQAPRLAEPINRINLGLGNALEVLNRDGVPLKRIVLPGAWLEHVQLPKADLRWAVLISSQINNANLKGALLGEAHLENSDLHGADFTGADFHGTKLSGAFLRGVNLTAARNLTQAQLDTACGSSQTKLPKGLTIRACQQ